MGAVLPIVLAAAVLASLTSPIDDAGGGSGVGRRWMGPLHDCQYERAVYLNQSGGKADIVVVGSSLAFRGIHGEEVLAGLSQAGRRVINLAIPGPALDPVRRWLLRVVVPLTRPDVVVIAFASRDLNLNGDRQQAAQADFDATPGWAFAARGDLAYALRQIAAGRWVGLHRAAVRRPDLVGQPLSGGWDPEAAGYEPPGWRQRSNWASNCNQVRPDDHLVFEGMGPAAQAAMREQLLEPFDLDGGVAALRRMVRRLQAAGITAVLVDLPVSLDYQEAHPGGAAAYEAYRARIRRLAYREGVLLVDAVDHFAGDQASFADARHLNVDGARRLSRFLGRVLQDLPGPAWCPFPPAFSHRATAEAPAGRLAESEVT